VVVVVVVRVMGRSNEVLAAIIGLKFLSSLGGGD